MKTLISLGFLLISILYAGAFVAQSAWGNGLKITFENEVAGVTPSMEILPSKKGMLLENGNTEMANTGHYANFKSHSKEKSPEYYAQKQITAERKYASAGFIVPDSTPVGTVTKLFELKLAALEPDLVFVDIGKRQGVEKGDRFTVYTLDRYIYHPVLPGHGFEKLEEHTRRNGFVTRLVPHPGKPVGHRVMIRGVLEITEPGDKVSYARVVKAYDSIRVGHLLMPYKKFEDQTSAFPQTDKSIEGYVIASRGDVIGIKYDDIIYIDKGWDDQVRPGDHFEVYTIPQVEEDIWYRLNPKKTPMLPFVHGEIKVIDTQKKTATAIIVKSERGMEIGDPIRFKRSHHPG